MLSSNISLTRPYNIVNFGPLATEIVSLVWGTPANFNGFRVLAALLHSQTAALNKRRHLYTAGRQSRWALAHISSIIIHRMEAAESSRHCALPSPPAVTEWSHLLPVFCSIQRTPYSALSLGMEVGLSSAQATLDGNPPPPKGAQQPPLFGHVYCGQTAGWIKMSLGREVGLGPDHIVIDWDPPPPK